MPIQSLPARKPDIFITQADMGTLRNLAFAAISMPEVADELLNELERAQTAEAADGGKYVGIGSMVTYITTGGDKKTVQLVLPGEADIAAGKVSVMTPVGVALIGLSAGQEIDWKARDGRTITLTVQEVRAA